MKIGFVSPYYAPALIGGIEWYLKFVTKLLAERGHDVHVFVQDRDEKGSRLPPEEVIEGVNVHRSPLLLDASYRMKLWPAFIKKILVEEPQILHVFDYAQFHDLGVALAADSRPWHTLMAVYDIHSQIPRSRIKSWPLGFYDRWLAKGIIRPFDRVLVRTPYQAEFIVGLGYPDERIDIAPPGIDDRFFEGLPDDEVESVRNKYAPDGGLVLYIGRLHPIKGVDVLIRAMATLKDREKNVKLVVVGPDRFGYTRRLRLLAEQIGVAGSVEFTGFLGEGEKHVLLAASDVLVLPSSFEGFGQTLIQGMAAGTPVIGTRVGGIPWVLEEGKAGMLVPYGNHEALSGSISSLLEDRELREKMVERGNMRSREFSYPVLVDRLEEIYQNF